MFKKTIAALAVAGAFGTMAAGAVYAADVTLYGVVDLGLKYSHVDADQSGVDAVDKLEMKSGRVLALRGLKTSATVSRSASSSKTALMRIPAASATTAACSAVKRAFISPATSVKWLSAAWEHWVRATARTVCSAA